MTKVLIVGLKDPAGGVESAVIEQVRHFDHNKVCADFVVFGSNFSLEGEIKAWGGKVIYLPSRVKKRAQYKAAIKNIFKNEKYAAVWCNFSGLTNIDFLKCASVAGVPCRIAHAHTSRFAWGNALMKYLVPMMHRKNQRVVDKYVTHFWACSPVAAEFMFGKNNTESVEYIRNSVDTEKYRRNEILRAEVRSQFFLEDVPVIIHVGRMCVAKNQKFLLDIFKDVLNKIPEAKLMFVGDGELHDDIIQYASSLGIEKSVVFTGTRDDVPRLLQGADAFLLPSVTEGLPVTVMEAQAAGLCCVVSREAVPDSADVTENVKFISLQESVGVWADAVISAFDSYIADGPERVSLGGYDSVKSSKELEKFFIEGKNI